MSSRELRRYAIDGIEDREFFNAISSQVLSRRNRVSCKTWKKVNEGDQLEIVFPEVLSISYT